MIIDDGATAERFAAIGGKLPGVNTVTKRTMMAVAVLVLVMSTAGCGRSLYDPAKATRAYPMHLHQPESIDVQVFRDKSSIELVNATPRSYTDFDLWINQRFVAHVAALPAGESVRLSLWDFRDERGERLNAGGFWRTEEPTPVRLVEIQIADEQPLIGLVTIRAEDIDTSGL